MRIGIDLDGVTTQFLVGCFEVCGVEVDLAKVTTWDALYDFVPPGRALWDWLEINHPDLFRNLSPIDGALCGIDELKKMGHTLVFITARPEWANGSAKDWLKKYGVPYDEVHELLDKTQVKCDVYIDDAPHNIEALRSVGQTIRMVTPYNYPLPNVYDAYDWDDIIRIIEMLQIGFNNGNS